MSDLEFNKIFAAVLVAGIIAMLGGFIAKIAVHPEELAENAYKIEVTDTAEAAETGPVGPEPILAMLAGADVEKGKKVAKKCMACHSFDKDGANKTGPNLYNVVNADKGHHAGFSYSDALKAHGGKWDYAELNHWLWDPKDLIPGTKMNFAGLSKPADRANLIAYLRTMADSPAALPSADAIAAESAPEAGGEAGGEEMEQLAPEAGGEAGDEMPAATMPEMSAPEMTTPETGSDIQGEAAPMKDDMGEAMDQMAPEAGDAMDKAGAAVISGEGMIGDAAETVIDEAAKVMDAPAEAPAAATVAAPATELEGDIEKTGTPE